ncbi:MULTISPECIES: phage/plasmid primase, P4 family [Burkholderiaceae]|jgi:P4 family phage/plasmid primase-like protien|uniref:Phage/plasmid primase P4 n=2 Tax=Burkholderiaceae TaxID=119060 RepID=A0A6J5JGD9_9BURK|nr:MULTISPECIES: phage/plasmid primase, P4 family [Burkholderiaceae]ANJ73076.1 hypothetical protein A9Y76_11610 [Ralstonia insidiosa]KAB0601863.1 hypothetical protein F7R19_15295 [Cupriavidus pauculus]UAL00297.1 DUF5906 domain-containing protein [Cupriavidus pauculus]CAB3970689.1 phage/plasmid primase P4 [Burkholderia aenigmatica]
MNNVIEEKENVNNELSQEDQKAKEYLDGVIDGLEEELRKDEATKQASQAVKPSKKATSKKTSKKVPAKADTETTQNDEEGGAKKHPPTIEHIFIKRKDTDGRFLINNYRRQGSLLFKWTGEYWRQQEEEDIKGMITSWLDMNYSGQFLARNLNSIYTMFTNSVLKFEKEQIEGIIIPTRHHWLKVDEKTGNIKAIVPDRTQPVKYIIDVIIPAEGNFTIPKKKAVFPPKSKFQKFLKTSLVDEAVRQVVQEYCGYTLTNTTRKQKMQWWVGKGANGKSVLIEILSSLHGNPVSVKINEVGQYNAHLVGASLVFATETDKKGFDQEFVKQAVSGDKVEVRAIYGKKQNAQLTAKWIMLMNDIPHITDFTDAIFRRVQLVNWTQQFTEATADENLAHDIIRDEKEEVLFWCLEGLQRMIKADWKFTKAQSIDNSVAEWRNAADKVRLFFVERNYHYDDDKKKKNDKQTIFEAFNKWADQNKFEQMSSTSFWLRANNIFPRLKEDQDMKDKNTGRRAVHLYIKAETIQEI